MYYDYNMLKADIDREIRKYSFAEYHLIGKSVMERDIPCLRIGAGQRITLIAAAFHGLESLTAALAMRFAGDYSEHINNGNPFFGENAARLFLENTLYVLPMINPDGVDIAVNGIDPSEEAHRKIAGLVGICGFKGKWQANAKGVDLNHNYDAHWEAVKEKPSPSKYGGEYPESEPETRALVSFVRRVRPDILIALHSQGGEIYCDFEGYYPEGALETAEAMSRLSGYKVCMPVGSAAFGGCKDWFIREFDRPGFTVEVGHGQNPLPMSMLDDIYEENARLLLCAMAKRT